MNDNDIHFVIQTLKKEYKKYKVPIVTKWAKRNKNPFHVLISCILSLRTKDKTTEEASERLFSKADTAETIIQLSLEKLEKLIYPVGFYKTKAKTIKSICNELLNNYSNKVPDTIEELLKLKGVGRKTANLVVTLGYNKLGICVDTHVHRISNRLGYVNTKNPEKTEFALRQKLPKKYWLEYNDLLVVYGQNVCTPVSPHCSNCSLREVCSKIGVVKFR